MPVFSMFVGQDALDAAINDELQPPLAYAELADPDDSAHLAWANIADPDDQVMARQKEYETNLAHVNHVVQLRQAKAAKAAQPQVGPTAGVGFQLLLGPGTSGVDVNFLFSVLDVGAS